MSMSSLDFIEASILLLQNAKEAFNKGNYNTEKYFLESVKEDIGDAIKFANKEIDYKKVI